ncbi:hypothetical protein [Streptomyces chryseus]
MTFKIRSIRAPPRPARITPTAEEAGTVAAAEAPQAVPQPRQGRKTSAAGAGAGKRATRTKASAKRVAAPKKQTAAKASAKKAAGVVAETPKSIEPPLHELVLGILRSQLGHPHLVREVYAELAEKHGRSTSVQVVRNSLESLVKKGNVEKENKQNSVMYTAPAAADAALVPEPAPEEVSDKAPVT